jgi:hypothetical protein
MDKLTKEIIRNSLIGVYPLREDMCEKMDWADYESQTEEDKEWLNMLPVGKEIWWE